LVSSASFFWKSYYYYFFSFLLWPGAVELNFEVMLDLLMLEAFSAAIGESMLNCGSMRRKS